MRTGIYCYRPATLTFATGGQTLTLQVLPATHPAASVPDGKPLALPAGIYKIVSAHAVQVGGITAGQQLTVVIDDKDPWPTPPPEAVVLAPGQSAQSIVAWFSTGVKGIDLP